MNLIDEIENVFLLSDEAEKENIIGKIGDLFECENLDRNEVIEGVNLLLSHVVHEKNGSLKESMLYSVNNAIVYKNVAGDVLLDVLLPYYSSFEEEDLSYVLSFFGFSGDRKYLAILKSYLNHSNIEIQEAAQEAITEIEFRSSKKK
ncbi:hypothetical protein [Metabacillus fastidiosus]|uniref:hypothetical protein n=1 Tax=Metabacillus fastidiosus TaxID=1458 RepID=UPI002DB5D056|nr:hypothetical protein [Metabacillus fastidiosus]MEC2077037.1 hypothetical protein [Metabacillus fastidiosus]